MVFIKSHLPKMESRWLFVLMTSFLVNIMNHALQELTEMNFGCSFWRKHGQRFMEAMKELKVVRLT